MATRRTPLANNPNATNSPYRAPTAVKRARPTTLESDNVSPPKKKQALQTSQLGSRRVAAIVAEEPRCGVFAGKPSASQPSNFQRKLVAARNTRQSAQNEKTYKPTSADKVAFQNWRSHYLKVFPSFVIYFESLPSDVGPRAARQIYTLGAREEKFFSKEVTHVITTRSIPPEYKSSRDGKAATGRPSGTSNIARADTIDPSMLNKVVDSQARGRHASDVVLQKRSQAPHVDARHQSSTDVLQKAHEMGIKIWTFEKFERMVSELLTAERTARDELQSRGAAAAPPIVVSKRTRDTDLSQLLREEKNNVPVDRRPWQEVVPFRGYYIYVHDMEERVKPVMIRDYACTAKNEDGEWPQFRSVSKGRCPFVEEPQQSRREEKERMKELPQIVPPHASRDARQTTQTQKASVTQPRDVVREPPRTRSITKSPPKRELQENNDGFNQMPKPAVPASLAKAFEPPGLQRQPSTGLENMPPMLGSAQANFRGIPRNPGGEPLASGVQQNITSAIRSQMFSSTAPSAPGFRAGISKQQHEMSRRVLERQTGFSANSVPSSLTINDVRAAINTDRAPAKRRSTRQRAAETMTRIHEDETLSEDDSQEADKRRQGDSKIRKQAPAKREAKPGYCENCRDKYNDFHQHIASKKHRKFALCDENFSELDALLDVLIRR